MSYSRLGLSLSQLRQGNPRIIFRKFFSIITTMLVLRLCSRYRLIFWKGLHIAHRRTALSAVKSTFPSIGSRISLQQSVQSSAASIPVTPLRRSFIVETPITGSLTGSSGASKFPEDSKEDSLYVDERERATFKTGDEQTVNACLIDLLKSVTAVCGLSRSAHFDRKAFRLGPKANPLYKAHVDGLLMIDDAIKGLMEIKPLSVAMMMLSDSR